MCQFKVKIGLKIERKNMHFNETVSENMQLYRQDCLFVI